MIKISDDPLTGFQRQVMRKDLHILESTLQVVLECYVSNFKDGILIENERTKSYIKNLIATNKNPVNKQTGVAIPTIDANDVDISEQVWADPMTCGQYDFFDYMIKNVPLVIENLCLQYISDNDKLGNFNI